MSRGNRLRALAITTIIGVAAPALAERLTPTGGASLVEVDWTGTTLTVRPLAPWDRYVLTVTGPHGLWEQRVVDGGLGQPLELESGGGGVAAGIYVYEVKPLPGGDDVTRTPRPEGAWGSFLVGRDGAVGIRGPRPPAASTPDTTFTQDVIIQKSSPRLVLDDTGIGSYDWELRTNGIEFLLSDSASNTVPLVVSATAPSNSIYIAADGKIGLGTATVPYALTIGDGTNSPTELAIRSADAQWKIGAYGSALRFVDTLHGRETLALQTSTGNVGVGTGGPQNPLHVFRSDGTAKVLVEEGNGSVIGRNLFQLKNNGPATFRFDNTSNGTGWGFGQIVAGNRFFVSAFGASALAMTVDASGNMVLSGALTQGSDRATKENIADVDPRAVLAEVRALPISTWSYKGAAGVSHIGPMAQDFSAAFGLGEDDRHIAPLDAAGVALAAIQALSLELRQRDTTIRVLESRVDALTTALCAVASTGREGGAPHSSATSTGLCASAK